MMTLPGRTAAVTLFETANERSVTALKMLAEAGKLPRLAMVGTSMLPLLRHPMVLELGPASGRSKVGDILVFTQAGRLVAHRVVGFRGDVRITAGDNTPWKSEEVLPDQLVGRVVAVYSADQPDAKRVDNWFFHFRGLYKARARGLRRLAHLATYQVRRAYRGLDAWHRPRSFPALVRILTAILNGNKADFDAALKVSDPMSLLATVRRHGCSSVLLQGVSKLGINLASNEILSRGLRDSSRATALKVLLLRNQINSLVSTLRQANVDFALLKGAARIYGGDIDAHFHRSTDIDVLIKRIDLDSAVAALTAAGYRRRASDERAALYLAKHHHYAPLRLPGGATVELHITLTRPGTLSRTLDWRYVSGYLRTLDGPSGEAQCLNEIGTVIHLATHAIGMRRLRDVVVLAQLLRRIDQSGLSHLRKFVDDEQVERVRLGAVFVMAAQLGGVAWDESVAVQRYLDWVLRREDLPIFLRTRCRFAEACYASEEKRLRFAALTSDLSPFLDTKHSSRNAALGPFRVLGRVGFGAVAYFYAKALPTVDR